MRIQSRLRSILESYQISAQGLALFRMFYALFVLLILSPGHTAYTSFAEFGSLPGILFEPPTGPFALFSGFPSTSVLRFVELGLSISLVSILIGFRTRSFSIIASALFLFGFGVSYSVGKINHNSLFILLPFLMSFSNWGSVWSVDSLKGQTPSVRSWPLAFLALFTSFAWFTAGMAKIVGNWLDPFTQASQGHLFRQFYIRDRQDMLASVFVGLDSPLFWEVLDYATVLFEVGFLIAFLRLGRMRIFVSVAMLFHLSTMLMMNIVFFIYMIPVYAAFIDWDHLSGYRHLAAGIFSHARSTGGAMILGSGAVFAVLLFLFGSPLLFFNRLFTFSSDMSLVEVATISVASVIAIAVLVACLLNLKRQTPMA